MEAKQMFEELGYLPPKIKLFSERNGHTIIYLKIIQGEEEKNVDRVTFHVKKKRYSRSGFTTNYNDILAIKECEFNHYINNDIKLHLAIHQQMKELGWI